MKPSSRTPPKKKIPPVKGCEDLSGNAKMQISAIKTLKKEKKITAIVINQFWILLAAFFTVWFTTTLNSLQYFLNKLLKTPRLRGAT